MRHLRPITPTCQVLVWCILGSPIASAQTGTVRFDVQYNEVREGNVGRMVLRRAVTVTLQGGNQITATEDVQNGRRGRHAESSATLGGSYQMFQGLGREGGWRVEAKDTLVRRSLGLTDTEILAVKALGPGSCTAGVGFVLLPGNTEYFRRTGWYHNIRAEDITCKLTRE